MHKILEKINNIILIVLGYRSEDYNIIILEWRLKLIK